MYSSDHDRLAGLISKASNSGHAESINLYADGKRWELYCEWNGGVPFLGFTSPDGEVSPCSADAAMAMLEHSSPLASVG